MEQRLSQLEIVKISERFEFSMPKDHFIVMKTGAFSAKRITLSPDENSAQAVLQVRKTV